MMVKKAKLGVHAVSHHERTSTTWNTKGVTMATLLTQVGRPTLKLKIRQTKNEMNAMPKR